MWAAIEVPGVDRWRQSRSPPLAVLIRRHDGDSAVSLVDSGGATSAAERPGLLRRVDIDISNQRPKLIEEFISWQFDCVITVCDNAEGSCPVFPGNAVRIHQSFDDPPPPGVGDDEFRLAVFRRVRDEIRQWTEGFIKAPGK